MASDILRSHDELRAAIRIAAAEIKRLNFGRRDSPILRKLRRIYRDARAIARAERAKSDR